MKRHYYYVVKSGARYLQDEGCLSREAPGCFGPRETAYRFIRRSQAKEAARGLLCTPRCRVVKVRRVRKAQDPKAVHHSPEGDVYVLCGQLRVRQVTDVARFVTCKECIRLS